MLSPFQFPTGWNSTVAVKPVPDKEKSFQFPTGWNSTRVNFAHIVYDLSFNSQRDGILRGRKNYFCHSEIVSIPNGMEFYIKEIRKQMETIEFQFPTGWNSTLMISLRLIWTPWSFNSQRDGILPILFSSEIKRFFSFNSQRDGILRLWFFNSFSARTFQFPTGWNSTLRFLQYLSRSSSFNSQRDGILPTLDRLTVIRCGFQFPTGWNSTRYPLLLVR